MTRDQNRTVKFTVHFSSSTVQLWYAQNCVCREQSDTLQVRSTSPNLFENPLKTKRHSAQPIAETLFIKALFHTLSRSASDTFLEVRIKNPQLETSFQCAPAAQALPDDTNSPTENLKNSKARKPVSSEVGAPRKEFNYSSKAAAATKLAPQVPPTPLCDSGC